MKKRLILNVLCIISFCTPVFRSSAQCNAYYKIKSEFTDLGWTVSTDRYVDLTPGQSSSAFSQYFSSSYDYSVVAFSCDGYVKDVDLFIYTLGGDLYSQDRDVSAAAFVSVSTVVSKYLQIVGKNYSSNSSYSSQIRILVFSKYKG